MIKKLAFFFISLSTLLVLGGMIMYSIRSLGPDIVTSIESIDVTTARADSMGDTETGTSGISFREMLENNPYRESPDYTSQTHTDQESLTK